MPKGWMSLSGVILATGLTCMFIAHRIQLLHRQKRISPDCKKAKAARVWDPIFGLDHIYKAVMATRNGTYLDYFRNLEDQCQSTTYTITALFVPLLVTTEPENMKTILALKFNDFGLEALRKPMRPVFGEGIFTSDGEAWHNSRAFVRPIFNRAQISDLGSLEGHVDRLISLIPRDGSTFDLQPMLFLMTMDVITDVLLGESTDCLISPDAGSEVTKFAKAFDRCTEFLATGDGYGPLGLLLFRSQFNRDCKQIHAFMDYLIEKEIQKTKSDETPNRFIFLKELLAQTNDKNKIRSELLNIMLAGRDTTAITTSNIWFELARNPSIFRRLKAEVDSLDPTEPLTFEILKSMPYLRAVINESLRLHPVVPQNARIATKDTMLPVGGGPDGKSPVFIPKGQIVAYSVYITHRRKDIFGEDAEEFRPERWLDDADYKMRPGWGFLPFNGGPRVCIGQQYALNQVSYITTRLVQAVSNLESRDDQPMLRKMTLTVKSMKGCKIAVDFREKQEQMVY